MLDSIEMLFREKLDIKDTSKTYIDSLSGKLLSEANWYMTYPIIKRLNEQIEVYCKKQNIDIFIVYPPEAIQYANKKTNYNPNSSDSLLIKKLMKCSIIDVTDSIISLINSDIKIKEVSRSVEIIFKEYKSKLDFKIREILERKKN
jgi:hypothetical protein